MRGGHAQRPWLGGWCTVATYYAFSAVWPARSLSQVATIATAKMGKVTLRLNFVANSGLN